MKPNLTFEVLPPDGLDGAPFYFDERQIAEACAVEIKDGPLKGVWMFSSKDRAEEFCWKHGFEPEFKDAEDIDD